MGAVEVFTVKPPQIAPAVLVKAEAGGWTTVRLQREGAGYHLHSVTVASAM